MPSSLLSTAWSPAENSPLEETPSFGSSAGAANAPPVDSRFLVSRCSLSRSFTFVDRAGSTRSACDTAALILALVSFFRAINASSRPMTASA
eukprot:CAMPEP_0118963868 /NCGR_PEP_ID=MMETSP1173-20130426/1692_1 /TAXON_ID=1034831 /ORGANISM="Rhizochromulina marina cf, Strain CCMP1243" /LENGTH=91 /DNA_ID=CAMNT_0006912271 /DNA_START=301 /DNA_END=572 /DNA_ORIENTATION=-